ncbi:hypothetical protein AVEN_47807-1 [Araneus ventricosus]|uniref:MULE transposase domain-containing protein n=1 Tax=Araneus ventricosus TaxID=182803 RepID=A0A4Y2ULB8_ARAVE|nr:hypothetical protein AVEN_47807-1 [Araneus ventricosus]
MDDGCLCIQETVPQHAKLREFFHYFVKEWLENSIITTRMWNCHKQQHRTNNTIEGWHNKFQTILSKPHPKFRNLLRALKDESKYSDFLISRMEINLEGKKRARKYVQLDERIARAVRAYEDTKDIRKCLTSLTYISTSGSGLP